MSDRTQHTPPGRSREESPADGHQPAQLRSWTLTKALLWIGVDLLLWRASTLVLMAFAGVLLSLLLDAMAFRLAKWTGMPRGWGVGSAVAVLFAVLGAAIWLLAGEVVSQADRLISNLPQYIESIREDVRSSPIGEVLLQRTGLAGGSEGSEGQSNSSVVNGVLSQATTVGGYVLSFLGNALLVLAVGIFLVVTPGLYRDGVLRLVRPDQRPRARAILDACDYNLRWWIVGKLCVMLLLGTLTTLGLFVVGMPYALTLGVAAMILSFIPYFGPILSFLPALVVALGESGSMVWYVIALYGALQLVESYLITPLVQQTVVHIPPALVILFQVLATTVLGFAGLMFAVPLLVVIMIVVKILRVSGTFGEEVDIPGLEGERLPA